MTTARDWRANSQPYEVSQLQVELFGEVQRGEVRWLNSRHVALLAACASMLLIVTVLLKLSGERTGATNAQLGVAGPATGDLASVLEQSSGGEPSSLDGELGTSSRVDRLSPVFAPTVLYWEAHILAWSAKSGVDADLAAIIMQIESCGDPLAVSSAGAMGLFQVMPFHFDADEDGFDPDTNAFRGLNYFADRLDQTNGDVGRAFAGYNGGHVAAANGWDSWASETQRYYTWSTGIHGDIQAGLEESPTLASWMAAGGAGLCRQAADRLGL